ncbi:MAG: TerB family tellurite resistance protein [Alphaproteobacteria bacterium]|nr:TerB family tellurite resistance protein [Alphaproteobacteria bacterium]
MFETAEILPSYLPEATAEQKKAFFQALVCLSGIDGHMGDEEVDYIMKVAKTYNINSFSEISNFSSVDEVIANVKEQINYRPLALELLREMCTLAHVDNVLSDEETLLIGKIGLALGIKIEKIEQISEWVVEHIIWCEQAKLIFEEKK